MLSFGNVGYEMWRSHGLMGLAFWETDLRMLLT